MVCRIDKAADAVVFLNLAGGYFIHVTDPSVELKKITISGQIRFLSPARSQEEIQPEEDRKEAVRREEERKTSAKADTKRRTDSSEKSRRREKAGRTSGSHGISASTETESKTSGEEDAWTSCGPTGYRKSTDRTAGIELWHGKHRHSFSYENNVLQIISAGHLTVRTPCWRTRILLFYRTGKWWRQEPITVVYRSDVAAGFLQIPEAESCGFSCVLVVHSQRSGNGSGELFTTP
ncbi:MAG: hypothetical protein ACLVAT_10760 [Lachnospiraceae bacterium]